MIIECPRCKKKFNIDINLIPAEGRNLQCGSCNHIWFYKKEDLNKEKLTINDNFAINKIENKDTLNEDNTEIHKRASLFEDIKIEKSEISEIKKTKSKPEVAKENQSTKFFSYLIVLIISLVASVILLDTLKTPLISVFPEFEMILFNLYETLKDIKLFIKDLI